MKREISRKLDNKKYKEVWANIDYFNHLRTSRLHSSLLLEKKFLACTIENSK